MSENTSPVLTSPPPPKKLKQARLPFKILEPKLVSDAKPIPNPVTFSKKRKPSDGAVGPQKAAKIAKNDDSVKGKRNEDAENEVSSSSEAEYVTKLTGGQVEQKGEKPRGLDRFVQSTQQLEVSTSCQDVIDLTSDASNEASSEGTKKGGFAGEHEVAPSKNTKEDASEDTLIEKTEKGEITSNTCIAKVTPEGSKSESSNDSLCIISPVKKDDSTDTKNDVKQKKQTVALEDPSQETVEDDILDKSVDSSAGSATSVTALSSMNESIDENKPGADSDCDKNDSMDKTSPAELSTTSTPRSKVLKRPPLSSSKKQEKEAERQRKQEERERLREEKLRNKELEKQKKEELKKLKEQQKEEQRLEKEKQKKEEKERKEAERLQREKEKQEKLAEKEKEKEEKQRLKEEEKRKKLEAQEAERKKKEEEKLKVEEEKSRKIQQTQALFKNFFKKVDKPSESVQSTEKVGPFAAFHVLANMKMAPRVRVDQESLPERCEQLDQQMSEQSSQCRLYLESLRSGDVIPGHCGRTWPIQEEESDVVVVDEASTCPNPVKMKKKLLQFHENYRPAYFGTWRKKSKTVGPRTPYKKDEVYLDYEVDSDDEWEEEEPGESLSHSEGEGEDGDEDNDDEDDDGFFVPHGYLSDGEGCEDDDEENCDPEKMKIRQMLKAKAWEADLKQQTKLLKALVIGCLWMQAGDGPDPQLSQYTAQILVDEKPILIKEETEEMTKNKKNRDKESRGAKALEVPDEAMVHLIRLVHGNTLSVKKLTREFSAYWTAHLRKREASGSPSATSDKDAVPLKSSTDPPAEAGEAPADRDEENSSSISNRQIDIKIRSIAVYEKRDGRKGSWYVNADILAKYELSDLPLDNQWTWLTRPNKPRRTIEGAAATDGAGSPTTASAGPTTGSKRAGRDSPTVVSAPRNTSSIKQFAVPGLVHANMLSALPSPARPPTSTVDSVTPKMTGSPATPGSTSSKKTPKRITPITLFCSKKTNPDSPVKSALGPSGKSTSSDDKVENNPVIHKEATTKTSTPVTVIDESDDDCMIVDDPTATPATAATTIAAHPSPSPHTSSSSPLSESNASSAAPTSQ